MSEPRLQHLLPSFYLSGFTDKGSADGFLHVFDYFNRKRYRARPGTVGREKDYYTSSNPDLDPFYVEKSFSQIESVCAPILRKVLQTGRFSGGKELGTLLAFMTLLYLRGKRSREVLSYHIEKTMYTKIVEGTVTREEYESTRSLEMRSGARPEEWPPFDKIKELVEKNLWIPKTPKNLKVAAILEMHQAFTEPLAHRIWSLARATPDSGGFICSDTPLHWSHPPEYRGSEPAHISSKDVVITVPLSKDFALITRDDKVGTYDAEKAVVAWVNSRTHMYSLGTLYSASDTFYLLRAHGVGLSTDYFKFVEDGWKNGVAFP